jgi:hypothetical protein
VMATLADGTRMQVQVDHHGLDLLQRLQTRDCALERIADVASVEFTPTFRAGTANGEPALIGAIVVTRRPGGDASTPLRITGVLGSVLLVLAPVNGEKSLPAELAPGQRELRIPVALTSKSNCPDHSLSQSLQTFFMNIYLRLPGDPEQGLIRIPNKHVQIHAFDMIDQGCGH